MAEVGIIIQARMGSTRLPGKVLLPFYKGQSILEIIIRKLLSTELNIVVATSTDIANNPIEALANQLEVGVYRGSEEDVLSRFVTICEMKKWSHCIRVCADNPFLDFQFVDEFIAVLNQNPKADYISYFFNDKPAILTHWGLWGELVSLKSLKIANQCPEMFYHEHVTNYIYKNPSNFNIIKLAPPHYTSGNTNLRLTIDSNEDFEIGQDLMKLELSTSQLIDTITSNQKVLRKMNEQINKNSK